MPCFDAKNDLKTKIEESMKRKSLLLLSAALLTTLYAQAQKQVYIPWEWQHTEGMYKESDPDNQYTYSKSRSKESENFIVFWDKGYGDTNPSDADATYRVDIDDLLKKAEYYYDVNVNKLGFCPSKDSYVTKYKGLIVLSHTTTWTCYGAGYDYKVPALWINPATSHPVGHAVSHEVGHSFQYMAYADASKGNTIGGLHVGFHDPVGSGGTIWEQCAQWQALQCDPSPMFSESLGHFRNTHCLAFTNEVHRYQSYWFQYYISEYYKDYSIVGQLWNHPMTNNTSPDFNEALMDLKHLSVEDLYRLYFDYACHVATWDFAPCEPYRKDYIGDFNYRCAKIGDHEYQVALASCPENTGFNVIPLRVPEAGTQVTTVFSAPLMRAGGVKLADADPGEYFSSDKTTTYPYRTYVKNKNAANRGFRVGYVVLLKDGTRQYINDDKVICKKNSAVTENVTMTVPENVDRMWLIVSPAPATYAKHLWNNDVSDDELWPYSFKLEGTDLSSKAIVYMNPTIDQRAIKDVKLTYDVYFPRSTTSYSGTSVTVNGEANAMLGTAFQLKGTDLTSKIVNYSSAGPKEGQIMFYGVNRNGALAKQSPTANGYGYWYGNTGNVSSYANGFVYSEFTPSTLTFNIGQYPGKNSDGSSKTLRQALQYKKSDTETATATFVFNIHFDAERNKGAELKSIEYDDKNTTGINLVKSAFAKNEDGKVDVYNVIGQKVKSKVLPSEATSSLPHGIYIIGGKKVIVP